MRKHVSLDRRAVGTVASLSLVGCILLGGDAQAATRFREFHLPSAGSYPSGITAGPDGNLWFTERSSRKIGRITTAGVITESPPNPGTTPNEITAGPDGNLWFTEYVGNAIAESRLP